MHIVIMAGGKGARFWPMSRLSQPKQLLAIAGEKTLIRQTVDRVARLVPPQNILIVTAGDHAARLAAQVPEIPVENILIEPCGRNTAPCICLAAMTIDRRCGDDTMVVLPADHYVADARAFCHIIEAACSAARETANLVTIGISPARPETGYGYIQCGEMAANFCSENFFKVSAFHEKPSFDRARQFVADRRYLWNSGMFVWRTSVILEGMQTHVPTIYHELRALGPHLHAVPPQTLLRQAYDRLPSVSIDYGLMEHAHNVLTVRSEFGWNDIGSWSAVYDVLPKDGHSNAVSGKVLALSSSRNLIFSPHKLTALVGVDDLIIVDTGDALLVCARDRAQDVKRMVEDLEAHDKKELL